MHHLITEVELGAPLITEVMFVINCRNGVICIFDYIIGLYVSLIVSTDKIAEECS